MQQIAETKKDTVTEHGEGKQVERYDPWLDDDYLLSIEKRDGIYRRALHAIELGLIQRRAIFHDAQ